MGQITDPNLEGFSDEAFEEPGENGLTTEGLAFRLQAKREQAAQDAGWVKPPEPDAPLDEVETSEAPTEVEDGEEVPAEEPEAEPGEPEEPEPEEPEEPEAEQDEFYVSTYRTREAGEEGMAEKDRTIDRLFKENHALTEQIGQQQQPAGQEELDVAAWSEWAQQAVEQGMGQQGAEQAFQQGGTRGFDLYMAYWVSDPEQAAQALAFNNEVQRHFATQNAIAAVTPLVADHQARTAADEAEQAKLEVASHHDDFGDYEEEMDRISQPGGPVLTDDTRAWLVEVAAKGHEGKTRAWEYLYMAAASSTAPQRRKEKQVERQRRKAATDEAKVQATVSSSEASGISTPLSEDELKVLRKKNAIRAKLGQPLLSEE